MPQRLDIDALIKEIEELYGRYGSEDFSIAKKAYEYAKNAHKNHNRKSGEPYIVHPISAARELMTIQPDMVTLVSTIIHDTVSDGTGTFDEIEELF